MREYLRRLGISGAFLSVTTLFFAWGFITSNNDPLLVTLRAVFRLSYAEALVTQLVFFLAYGLFSLPAASLAGRFGTVQSILGSLGMMIAGCLLVRLSVGFGHYGLILASLFVLASGITALQVTANPLATALGPAHSSHFRLNLAQSLNSLGVVIGVQYGAAIMLGGAALKRTDGHGLTALEQAQSLRTVDHAFTVMALLLAGLALFVWTQRRRIAAANPSGTPVGEAPILGALRSRWAITGAVAIGLYVGAEVSIGSIMINFLGQQDIMALPLETGGQYLAIVYWGGSLAGRLIGSVLLTRLSATRLLCGCALMATGLSAGVVGASGAVAGMAALSIGLFNSIMFPTIFSITLERSSAPQSATSGLLCLAIVAGALLPLLVGVIADWLSLSLAFGVPALAYFAIAVFAVRAGRAYPRGGALHPA